MHAWHVPKFVVSVPKTFQRQSGPAQPVVARPTNLSQPVAEDANNSQGQPAGVGSVAGDDDSQTSTSGESKNDRSIASSRSFDNADSADTSAVEQVRTLLHCR